MGRYGDLDYAFLVKAGFLIGVAMFVIGAGGEFVGHAFFEPLPAWEDTLLFGLEAGGLIVAFFSPWIFGVLLPLKD